jgi:hypothetical protein
MDASVSSTPALRIRRWNHADPEEFYDGYIPAVGYATPQDDVASVHAALAIEFERTPTWEFSVTYMPDGAPEVKPQQPIQPREEWG